MSFLRKTELLCLLFFGLYVISAILFVGATVYVLSYHWLIDSFILVSILYMLYIQKKKAPKINRTITENVKSLFESNSGQNQIDDFKKFNENLSKRFLVVDKRKKITYVIYFIGFTSLFVVYIIQNIIAQYLSFGNTIIIINPGNMGYFFLFMVFLFMLGVILITLANILLHEGAYMYEQINEMNRKEYNIKILYRDIKSETVKEIGNSLLSIVIPTLLFSIIFCWIGLIYLFLFNNLIWGAGFTAISLIIVCVIVPLFYQSITQLHHKIQDYKKEQQRKVTKEIDRYNPKNLDSQKNLLNYIIFYFVHNYYDNTVESVKNWPFDIRSLYIVFIDLIFFTVQLISFFIGLTEVLL